MINLLINGESRQFPAALSVARLVELLSEHGPNSRLPFSRAMGGGLFELRPRGRTGRRRRRAKHTAPNFQAFGRERSARASCRPAQGRRPAPYHRRLMVGALELTMVPAGYAPGSAQLLVEGAGDPFLYAAHVSLRPHPMAEPPQFLQVPTLVLRTPYGDPRFALPAREEALGRVVERARELLAAGRVPVFLASVVGKAPEVTRALSDAFRALCTAAPGPEDPRARGLGVATWGVLGCSCSRADVAHPPVVGKDHRHELYHLDPELLVASRKGDFTVSQRNGESERTRLRRRHCGLLRCD